MSQGTLRRLDKMMDRAAADGFLERAAVAHFATVSANGDPYVVPNLWRTVNRTKTPAAVPP